MKLTNLMRDAFVRSVMNDVPQVDYQSQAQKIAQAYCDEAFAKTFPGIDKRVVEDEGWVERAYLRMPGSLSNFYSVAPAHNFLERDKEIWAQLDVISTKLRQQQEARNNLEGRLIGIARSATTRKRLAEMLPEFEKYLPADEPAACKTLPALANVVSDFVKAGWPKQAGATS